MPAPKPESPASSQPLAEGVPRKRKPRRRRPAPSESTVAIIDRLLLRPFSLTVNGEAVKLSTAEAIILHLTQKAVSGNSRAWQIISKYQEFANRHSSTRVELKYVDSEYTQSFAKEPPGGDNG